MLFIKYTLRVLRYAFYKVYFPFSPEILHTMNKQTIWKQISQCIFFFFLASFAGFCWEVILLFMKEGTLYKRGFFYGPWLPVYGVGAVLIYLTLQSQRHHPIRAFTLSALIGGGTELAIGWLLDAVWELRYWDYTNTFLNFRGYVCLWSFLGFGVAGMIWICFFIPLLERFWEKVPPRFKRLFLTLLLVLFMFDCAAALIFPNEGKGITFSSSAHSFYLFPYKCLVTCIET